jgi:hypothetical protein
MDCSCQKATDGDTQKRNAMAQKENNLKKKPRRNRGNRVCMKN